MKSDGENYLDAYNLVEVIRIRNSLSHKKDALRMSFAFTTSTQNCNKRINYDMFMITLAFLSSINGRLNI